MVSFNNQRELIFMADCNSKSVSVTSDFYVPFEPQKSNIDIREKVVALRDCIKTSLKELVVEEDEILLASYSETDKNRFYDVENMLFYNIGTSAFTNCCESQVAFIGDDKRFSQKKDALTGKESKYFYSYKVVKIEEVYNLINKKDVIAYWKDIDINLDIPQSATRYYSAIRENSKNINIEQVIDNSFKLFGMKIDVTMPNKNLPASIMKPLLDGLICAFHGEQGKTQDVLKLMFGNCIGEKYGNSDSLNILGERQYVDTYRGANSFKWNPEDERLQFAWITVKKGDKAKISGKIFEW